MKRTSQLYFNQGAIEEGDTQTAERQADKRDYDLFVKKFVSKKTTDDCYTPPGVFEVIKDWCVAEYGIDPDMVVRPFYPGGDFMNEEYPDGCVVLDNPPFSILARIVKFYVKRDIPFFLFAPALTLFQNLFKGDNVGAIIVGADVIYENGAHVTTSFITSLDPAKVRTAPDLKKAIERAVAQGQPNKSKPVVEMPRNVTSSARIQRIADLPFSISRDECISVKKLDKGAVFGGGIIICDDAADRFEGALERVERERVEVRNLLPSDQIRLERLNEARRTKE